MRSLLTIETTKVQYTHGANEPGLLSLTLGPSTNTSWTAQATTTSSLDLFYNYPSNVALYDKWHEYFRKHQPRMLILWGQNDPFFAVAG